MEALGAIWGFGIVGVVITQKKNKSIANVVAKAEKQFGSLGDMLYSIRHRRLKFVRGARPQKGYPVNSWPSR